MSPGADLLPAFKRNTSKFAHLIVPHQGNLHFEQWRGEPIEILFVDAAKDPALLSHIVNTFFPHLRPGGYVIHQDFISAEDPWIHVAMGLLAPYFEVTDSPDGGSICFRVLDTIPPNSLPADYMQGQRHLIRAARDLLPGWHGLCLELAEAHYLALTGSPEEAQAIVAAVSRHPLYKPRRFEHDVRLVQNAIKNVIAPDAGTPLR